MKKKLLFACLMAATVAFTGCEDYDDSEITAGLESAEDRLDALEEWQATVDDELAALQTIIAALETNDYVTNVEEITSNGVVLGYEITFAQYGTIKISNGTDGVDGEDGEDGEDGAAGTAGAAGSAGADGDSIFAEDGVKVEDGIIYFTLADGVTTYEVLMYVDTTIELELGYLIEGDNAVTVNFPTSLAEEDYSAMMVEIIDSEGNSGTNITTKASVGITWSVDIKDPVFVSGVGSAVVNINAVQTISVDVANLSTLLRVTLVTADNQEIVSTFPLEYYTSTVISDNILAIQTEINTKIEAGQEVITVSKSSGVSDAVLTLANTTVDTEVNLTIANFNSGTPTLAINDYSTDSGDGSDLTSGEFVGTLYLTINGSNSGNLSINLPGATVYINGTKYASVDVVAVSQDTFHVTEGSKVTTLKIEKGNTVVNGEVTTFTSTGEGATLTVSGESAKVDDATVAGALTVSSSAEVGTATVTGGETTVADGASITTSLTTDANVSVTGSESSITKLEVTSTDADATVTVSVTDGSVGTIESTSGNSAAVEITTSATETSTTATVGTVTNNATASTAALSVTTAGSSTVDTVTVAQGVSATTTVTTTSSESTVGTVENNSSVAVEIDTEAGGTIESTAGTGSVTTTDGTEVTYYITIGSDTNKTYATLDAAAAAANGKDINVAAECTDSTMTISDGSSVSSLSLATGAADVVVTVMLGGTYDNILATSDNQTFIIYDENGTTRFANIVDETIADQEFMYNQYIQNAVIPSSVTSIGNSAFQQSSLVNLRVLGSQSYGNSAFKGCASLAEIKFVDGATNTYAESVFVNCNALSYVDLGNTPTIGYQMFASVSGGEPNYNDNVTGSLAVTIPNTVTNVYAFAFKNNTIVNSVAFEDGNEVLTTISYQSFAGTSITSAIIPASVTTIGFGAFADCDSFTSLTMLGTVPPTLEVPGVSSYEIYYDLFYGADSDITITVPDGYAAAYAAVEYPWYATISEDSKYEWESNATITLTDGTTTYVGTSIPTLSTFLE